MPSPPFHRVETPTQTVADAQLQQNSNEIWGKAAAHTAQSETHLALRHTELVYLLVRGGLNSSSPVALRPILERPLRRDGPLELLECYNQPMRREPFLPQSRYQSS